MYGTMALDPYLPHILALNILLTIVDAAVGYHAAPVLVRGTGGADEESLTAAAKRIRAMLTLVVALYSFFSCLAYYRQKPLLLLVVTAVIIADIIAQMVIGMKMRRRER
jgi:hypothetical protein